MFPLQSLYASVFWLLPWQRVSKSRRLVEEEAWRGDLGDVSGEDAGWTGSCPLSAHLCGKGFPTFSTHLR